MTRTLTDAYAAAYRAGDAAYPPACLRFVLDTVRSAALRRDATDGLTPPETVRALADAARNEFGPLDALVRGEWGLLHGADAGGAIRLLERCGALKLAPEDTEDAFAAIAWPAPEAAA